MKTPRFRIRLTDFRHERVTIAGRRMIEGPADLAVRRFLGRLDDYLSAARAQPGPRGLLPFRDDFRRIVAHEPLTGLARCVGEERAEQQRIAIWLLGRIGGQRALSVVAILRSYPDVRIRRRVARALVRTEGWQYLRDMAHQDPDSIVRRIAASAERPPRPFPERIGRFLARDVRRTENRRRVMPEAPRLFLDVGIGRGLPPRSPEFIRAVLERIRRLVAASRPSH